VTTATTSSRLPPPQSPHPPPELKIIAEFLEDSNLQDSSVDFVILGNVLCEVPNQTKIMEKVKKLLKPGGYVL
jgi:2-polyprenyl-3-methyl-5-hydroxy-6-metoxy-1,4-benzoquinol methylase